MGLDIKLKLVNVTDKQLTDDDITLLEHDISELKKRYLSETKDWDIDLVHEAKLEFWSNGGWDFARDLGELLPDNSEFLKNIGFNRFSLDDFDIYKLQEKSWREFGITTIEITKIATYFGPYFTRNVLDFSDYDIVAYNFSD